VSIISYLFTSELLCLYLKYKFAVTIAISRDTVDENTYLMNTKYLTVTLNCIKLQFRVTVK